MSGTGEVSMDFFSLLNQRQLDQNSEFRRLYRLSACYATGAVLAMFVAALIAPAGTPTESRRGDICLAASLLFFLSSSIAAYLMMVKALNVLSTSRFILPSSFGAPRLPASSLLIPVSYEGLTFRQRMVFVYGLLVSAIVSVSVGVGTNSYYAYLLLLFMQFVLFIASWVVLSRMMNVSR
ncbi:uncharacterized protein TM35_000272200 [Trypanosoma theileri]|uniref:Uncharacterized protein n=1 Tax=Trypanosoma theileri TaxID=67003 RepID=A0A1X0NRA2_9TRYP|nr:uncharacterized protein TM35_000272200 [Trypanosoma theileri]ORC86630.1 hypothetical protein TM35_000272200 [Trypanosoma theileri]